MIIVLKKWKLGKRIVVFGKGEKGDLWLRGIGDKFNVVEANKRDLKFKFED